MRAGAHLEHLLTTHRHVELQDRVHLGRHNDDQLGHGVPSGFNEITVDGRGNIYVNGADLDFLSFIDRAMKDMAAGDRTPLHERPDFVPGYIAWITPDGEAQQWPATSPSPTAWW